MATRQECIDRASQHAGTASEMLAEVSDRLLASDDLDPDAAVGFMHGIEIAIAGAHAHAAVSQAWSALHEMQFGSTVRIDQP